MIDFASFKKDRSLRGSVARTPCIKVGAKAAVRDIGAEERGERANVPTVFTTALIIISNKYLRGTRARCILGDTWPGQR